LLQSSGCLDDSVPWWLSGSFWGHLFESASTFLGEILAHARIRGGPFLNRLDGCRFAAAGERFRRLGNVGGGGNIFTEKRIAAVVVFEGPHRYIIFF